MASYTWVKGGDGKSWNDVRNWNPRAVPQEGDEIMVPGKYGTIGGPTVPSDGFRLKSLAMLPESGITGTSLVIDERFAWDGGSIMCPIMIAAGCTLQISGAVEKNLMRGKVLQISGSAESDGSGVIQISESSMIRNAGTFTARASVRLYWSSGSGATFENVGTLRVQPPSGSTVPVVVLFDQAQFVSSGPVVIQKHGVVTLVGSAATLHTLRTGTYIGGEGRMVIDGYVLIDGTPSVTSGGTVEIGTNGALAIPASSPGSRFWCYGTLDWTGGIISAPVHIAPNAALMLSGTNPRLAGGATLENAGSATAAPSLHLRIGDNARFVNRGSLAFAGGAVIEYDVGAGGWFENRGNFTMSAGASAVELRRVAFTNTGVVNLHGGTLTMTQSATYRQEAGATRLEGGQIGGTSIVVDIAAGSLTGSGTVTGRLRNGGLVQLDTPLPGVLTVDGTYEQISTGTYRVRVSSSGHDLIQVTGVATLAGTLEVALSGGTPPAVGAKLPVMSYASRTGQFSNVRVLGGLKTLRRVSVVYEAKEVFLVVEGIVTIGTKDGSAPPTRLSVLQVKTVEGIGCGTGGGGQPACQFQWFRSAGQGDGAYQALSPQAGAAHEYDLGLSPMASEWHWFMVRATNPQTGVSAYSDPKEVDSIVPHIMGIMDANGWTTGAKLQDRWLSERPKKIVPDYAPPEAGIIEMDPWLLTFPEVEETYVAMLDRLASRDWRDHEVLVERLGEQLVVLFEETGDEGASLAFGDLDAEAPVLDEAYIIAMPVRFPGWDTAGAVDDRLASFLNLELRAAVVGVAEPVKCPKGICPPGVERYYRVRLDEAGLFAFASYDFQDTGPGTRPLGYWDPVNMTASILAVPGAIPLSNSVFRQWQDHHNRGGDFKAYSDVRREPLGGEFLFPWYRR